MDVTLINNAGIRKECPTGFSWSTMFLGFLVPLSRGDLIGMVIHILVTLVSVGIAWFVWPFMYNKNYINRLLEKGYIPYSEKDLERLKEIGIDVLRSYESQQGNKKAEGQKTLAMATPPIQKIEEPVVDSTVVGNYDFSDRISMKWPVEVQSGTLMKRDGQEGKEDLSCSISFKNVLSRGILYTEWQLKCFDILKRPILTEIPVSIRHEAKLEPKETVTVKSSGPLPSGTRSFIPYLKAVLYADQKIEEFSDDEQLLTVKPRTEISKMEGFNQLVLEDYKQEKTLTEIPRYLYEKREDGIWTCGFCGARNTAGDHECRLCSAGLEQQELCARDQIERIFADYAIYLEQLEEEKRKREEEERQQREEAERKRLEDEKRKAQEERERNERKSKKQLLGLFFVIVVGLIGFILWNTVLEDMYVYDKAQKALQAGQSFEAYHQFYSLGDYKDAREQSLEAYRAFLEMDSSVHLRIDGYQWLLDNGYPKEKVFESFSRILESEQAEEAVLNGWRWLDGKGYAEAKASIYGIAKEMMRAGRYYDAHGLFTSLGDYRDARDVAALTVKVSFDTIGGSTVSAHSYVLKGDNIPEPEVPERAGYGFEGWYKEAGFVNKWDFGRDVVTADMTLYAKWSKLYAVGDIGPTGGYTFYDKGIYSDGWRYLEAAPERYEFKDKVWGGDGTTVGGTGTSIGTGKVNTERIVAKFGNAEPYEKRSDYAAKVCANLVVYNDGVAYDDWFLPSKNELDLMYQNLHKKGRGGFSEDIYWSSSELNDYYAWLQGFGYGNQYAYGDRYYVNRVRPVRAF